MTAPVRIDASAWGDLRFATLARLCGFADADHALIKCAKIWSWQTEHYTDESPTYVVEPDIVESALGPGGADHLVRARLAEAGPDGLRIRGSKGRIEWLWKTRAASKRGGEATRRKHADKEGPSGQPAARPMARPEPGPKGGPLTPDLSPDRSDQNTHTRARERHPDTGRIARLAWDLGAKLCGELKHAKVAGIPPWPLMHDADHPGWVALLDRVGELLIAESVADAERIAINRVNVAAAKAKNDGEGQWFASTSMFTRNSFEHWARLDPNAFDRKTQRAGPRRAGDLIGAATPRTDHPEGTALIPISDLRPR